MKTPPEARANTTNDPRVAILSFAKRGPTSARRRSPLSYEEFAFSLGARRGEHCPPFPRFRLRFFKGDHSKVHFSENGEPVFDEAFRYGEKPVGVTRLDPN